MDVPNCPDGYVMVRLSWSSSSGTVTGYRVYFTPGTFEPCTSHWRATGRARLVSDLGPRTIGWTGRLNLGSVGGKYGVVAYNGAGTSAGAITTPIYFFDFTCP